MERVERTQKGFVVCIEICDKISGGTTIHGNLCTLAKIHTTFV